MIIKPRGGIRSDGDFTTKPIEEYEGKRFHCKYSYRPLSPDDRMDLAGANKVDIREDMYSTEVTRFIRICAKHALVSMDSVTIVDSDEAVEMKAAKESMWIDAVPGLAQDVYDSARRAGGDVDEEKKD